MLLPKYAVEVIDKYKGWRKANTLLPFFWIQNFNKHIQKIGEIAGWTETHMSWQYKRGLVKTRYKDPKRKKLYRFCDLLTSHTMRRTAISVMMQLKVDEEIVRRISGHSPRSKSFYQYVRYSRFFMDEEMDLVYKKMAEIKYDPYLPRTK